MSKVTFHRNQDVDHINSVAIEEIYKLRHETFVERLDWEVESRNGEERDEFDRPDTVNVIVAGTNGKVDGCWRALPTEGDYMLKSIFPELLQGEPAPVDSEIWEISRFAVRKGSSGVNRGCISQISVDMVRSFWDFAQEQGVKAYVTVTTVAGERMLRQLGLTLRRMGEGKSLQVGKEKSVALYIEVDSNLKITTN